MISFNLRAASLKGVQAPLVGMFYGGWTYGTPAVSQTAITLYTFATAVISSGGTASDSSVMEPATCGNNLYARVAGGVSGGTLAGQTARTIKYTYSSTSSAAGTSLSGGARVMQCSFGRNDFAYYTGGEVYSGGWAYSATVCRYQNTNDSVSNTTSLPAARAVSIANSSQSAGYARGGNNSGGTFQTDTGKISYSDSSTSASTALSSIRGAGGGSGSKSAGHCFGNSTFTTQNEKLAYSSEANSTSTALASVRGYCSASGNETKCVILGGASAFNAYVLATNLFTYSTEAMGTSTSLGTGGNTNENAPCNNAVL